MKELMLIFLIVQGGWLWADETTPSCPTSNGYIESKVDTKARASMLHTVEHRWKFEFWRGAVCWGKPDDQYQDSQDYNNSSTACSGNMTFATSRDNQLNYTPMSLSWGANLTEGDTFTLHFEDNRTRVQTGGSDSECTRHQMSTKLEYASVTYDTRAVLNVPEDVWIVQVRGSAANANGADLSPKIGRKNSADPSRPGAHLISLSAQEWTYLYVEPGEPLELTLSYQEQGLDIAKKYDVRYDFKFVGYNRCTEVLGQPEALDYSQDSLDKIVFQSVKTESDFHNYALRLGCLRNPVFLKSAMRNSRPESLRPMLDSIESRTKDLLKREGKSNSETYAAPFVYTILDMTLVDVSRFALADLYNYCKSYRLFTRESAIHNEVQEVAGIEYMMMTFHHLDKIYSQLARQSLQTLVDRINSWNQQNVTYAQLYEGNTNVQQALRAYQHQMVASGLEIYGTLVDELQKIPQTVVGQTHLNKLMRDLADAKVLASEVKRSTQQLLRDFGRRSNKAIEVGGIKTAVENLIRLDASIHQQMLDYFSWFLSENYNGDNGDRFVQTLIGIKDKILLPSAENLHRVGQEKSLNSLDEKFVRRKEINELSGKIEKCIFQPYEGKP